MDSTWSILWANTPPNALDTQRCPGGAETIGTNNLHRALALGTFKVAVAYYWVYFIVYFPAISVGNATRYCTANSEWEEPSVINCVPRQFQSISDRVMNKQTVHSL